jgi:hypothetical protein
MSRGRKIKIGGQMRDFADLRSLKSVEIAAHEGGSKDIDELRWRYKKNGDVEFFTGDPGADDIVFGGSKSDLRRIEELERNMSVLATKVITASDPDNYDSDDDAFGQVYDDAVRFKNSAVRFSSSAVVFDGSSTINFGNRKLAAVDDPTADQDAATKAYVDTKVASLVDSAPAALDTLNELAAALGDDANFVTTTSTALGNRLRVDTAAQGLTSTQKSNAKTNLGLATVASTGAYSDLTGTPTIPTNNNQLTNGAGYITGYSVTQGDVTAHQAALSITESQISDLGSYLTSETSHADVVVDGDFTSQGIMLRGASAGSYSILTDNSSNWNTAYSWGNHSTQGYLTSVPAQSFASLTGKPTTLSGYGITDGYTNSNVDTHLNQSNPTAGYVLSWNGSDYAWVDNAGYTNSDVDTHLNQSNPTAGYVLSWNGSDYAWVEQSGGGGTYSAQGTAPSSPNDGDEWYDTDTGDFYKYINDGTTKQWVEWSPGQSGPTLDGTVTVTGDILPDTTNTRDLGSSSAKYAEIHATTFLGTATQAQYADLAEMYAGDQAYEPGTVVVVGGTHEVTQCTKHLDSSLAGVVSEKPGYLMNKDIDAEYPVCVGFVGRVPVKVVGHIEKGDLLTTSSIPGFATKYIKGSYEPGCIIGVALNTKNEIGEGTVEVLLKRS